MLSSLLRRLAKEEIGGAGRSSIVGAVVAASIFIGAYATVGGGGGGSCDFPTCFPDASTTGVPAGTSLTAYSGPTNITTNNTVIDSKQITSCLTINATGVIIKNSTVSCNAGGSFTIDQVTGDLTIQDSEIDCQGSTSTGIGSSNITALRIDLSGCENGFDVDSNITVTDSYIHDLTAASGTHTDGMQFNEGGDSVTVRHNLIVMGTSAGTNATIIMYDGAGVQGTNMLIERNRLDGNGGTWTIYTPRNGPLTNVKVINNRIKPTSTGYNGGNCAILTDGSGNIDDATGNSITLC